MVRNEVRDIMQRLAISLLAFALCGCGVAENIANDQVPDVDIPVSVLTSGSGLIAVGPSNTVVAGHDSYRVGDSAANDTYVTALSFAIGNISEPSQARFKRAILRIALTGSVGNPQALAPLTLHHADASTLGAFDASWSAAPSVGGTVDAGIANLADVRSYDIDVTSIVSSDRAAGRVVSLILLRTQTPTNANSGDDYAIIVGAASPSGAPQLILTFAADVNL